METITKNKKTRKQEEGAKERQTHGSARMQRVPVGETKKETETPTGGGELSGEDRSVDRNKRETEMHRQEETKERERGRRGGERERDRCCWTEAAGEGPCGLSRSERVNKVLIAISWRTGTDGGDGDGAGGGEGGGDKKLKERGRTRGVACLAGLGSLWAEGTRRGHRRTEVFTQTHAADTLASA